MRIPYDCNGAIGATPGRQRLKGGMALGLWLGWCAAVPWSWAGEAGVTATTLRVGSTLSLDGDARVNGESMKRGMEAAFKNEKVQDRAIELAVLNDSYDPKITPQVVNQLIEKGIFVMLGSSGTPTAKAALPILAQHKIPAVGFYNGAGFTGPGDVLNFRPSYAQEIASIIDAALAAGMKPAEVCAFVQNDAFGMAGLAGMKAALAKQSGTADTIVKLDRIMALEGTNPERNNIGPVGTYQRDTLNARRGYQSLKQWETSSGTKCRLIITVGLGPPTANFIAYTLYKGEKWLFSIPSISGSKAFIESLKEKNVTSSVLATAVVPAPNATLPIVEDARKSLGQEMNPITMEGYMAGRMFLAIARNIKGELTRENFLKAARSQVYDVGGMKIDFTTDNQGSDFVLATVLRDGQFTPLTPQEWAALLE